MRLPRFAAVSLAALSLVAAAPAPRTGGKAPTPVPTPGQARVFVAEAEAVGAKETLYLNRAQWVQATFITDDTNWLAAKANAEGNELAVRYAKGASRFDRTAVDAVTRRKLDLLKQGLVLPASSRPGAAQELADVQARLSSAFSATKVDIGGEKLVINDLEDRLRTERDPKASAEIWLKWHDAARPMKADYQKLVTLSDEGARELGYPDAGALWRSWYDMPPDAFAAKADALWAQVRPLYVNLHCYVRGKLSERYGPGVQPDRGPIRADLTGNMWAQEWGNIYEVVKPTNAPPTYDLTQPLQAKGYTPVKMLQTADGFYQSLGFAPMPATFWTRSQITKPADRDVVCHASAWDVDTQDDLRVKMCTKVNADDFFTVHHEMGHNIYQRAYKGQPFLFQDGANDGFHEAIGDFAGLNALTPTYLKSIGLIDTVPGPESDIPYLLKMALDKVSMLPWALMVDKWRWDVFSGKTAPAQYNTAWWALKTKYQGVTPPGGPRPADGFDPGAKFHVADSTPYARYFLAAIYEFQFYRAACRQAGWTGPLNRCSVYGNKQVGRRFAAMLEMGKSKPWPEALAAFTGERDIDAGAVAEYFAPLNTWLQAQNKGRACGWD